MPSVITPARLKAEMIVEGSVSFAHPVKEEASQTKRLLLPHLRE